MQQRTNFNDSDDLVCRNCNCEIMIKHVGDSSKGYGQQQYICSCGQPMTFEHQRAGEAQTAGMSNR